MKRLIIFNFFLIFISSTVFAMDCEKNNLFVQKITIKNRLSKEEFMNVLNQEKVLFEGKEKRKLFCSVLKGGGGTTWSYPKHHENLLETHSKIYQGKVILTVYALTNDGEQKAFMGAPDVFFAFNTLSFKPIMYASVVLQSSRKKIQLNADQSFSIKEFFSKIKGTLGIVHLKTYWIKCTDNDHNVAMVLKPGNQSYILLEDTQLITFKYP